MEVSEEGVPRPLRRKGFGGQHALGLHEEEEKEESERVRVRSRKSKTVLNEMVIKQRTASQHRQRGIAIAKVACYG